MQKQWAISFIYFFIHEKKNKMIRETQKYLSHCIVYSFQTAKNIIEIAIGVLSWAKHMPFFTFGDHLVWLAWKPWKN